MTITAKVVAASVTDAGCPPIYSIEARYPRFIHAEVMTHRVFGRNASSSRAVPVKKMIEDVLADPAMPVRWGKNQPGMQDAGDHDAKINLDFSPPMTAEEAWLYARDAAVEYAKGFAEAGYHKQIVNRLLEPFSHITVIITATEWKNFFDLRCHEAADPTMRTLAETIRHAMASFEPEYVGRGGWHLPYVSRADHVAVRERGYTDADQRHKAMRLISAARCARVSYLNHDGSQPDIEKDLELASRLLADKHMSPFEHQASPDHEKTGTHLWGNLSRWYQSRKLLEVNL